MTDLETRLLAACKAADALLTNLFKAVDWGRTFDLDIAALNHVACELPRVIALAEARVPSISVETTT